MPHAFGRFQLAAALQFRALLLVAVATAVRVAALTGFAAFGPVGRLADLGGGTAHLPAPDDVEAVVVAAVRVRTTGQGVQQAAAAVGADQPHVLVAELAALPG
jgi:hypothetical protein